MLADAENEPPTFLPPGSTMHKRTFPRPSTADIVYYLPHHPEQPETQGRTADARSPAVRPPTRPWLSVPAFGNQATLVSGLGRHPLAHVPKHGPSPTSRCTIDCSDQPRRPPILASILVDLSTGERSVVYSTDLRKLRSDAVNESLLEDTDILMLDGYFLPQAVQLAGWARPLEIPVVLDGGSWKEGLDELLPLVDYAICSTTSTRPAARTRSRWIDHQQPRPHPHRHHPGRQPDPRP